MKSWIKVIGLTGLLMLCGAASAREAPQAALKLDIKSQPINDALNEFARQSGLQIFFLASEESKSLLSAPLMGTFEPQAALTRLLRDTGLAYEYLDERTIAIRSVRPSAEVVSKINSLRLVQSDMPRAEPPAQTSGRGRPDGQGGDAAIPEVLVQGSRVLNMDIKRTREDAQPYVVFDREVIERSGATNLEGFLKQRLPMNATAMSGSQANSFLAGNTSSINLRGLGANQTLILIDGHRKARGLTGISQLSQQSDLNGIPIAAIERIEVLPATASGIYGGGATGGVINVVMRRDYTGVELKVNYENTFASDASIRTYDLAAGFSLEEGRTTLLVAANYSDQSPLFVGDRDLVARYRQRLLDTFGGNYYSIGGTAPPISANTNIRSVNGSPLFGPGTSNVTFIPTGYAGGGGVAPLQVNAGRFSLDLADTYQSSVGGGQGKNATYGSVPEVGAISATLRRQFTPGIDAFLDLAASSNSSKGWVNTSGVNGFTVSATAPNNPFNQAIQVSVPIRAGDDYTTVDSDERRVMGGVIFRLPAQWRGSADYTWSRSRYAASQARSTGSTATAAVLNGVLDVLRDPSLVDFSPYVNPNTVTLPFQATLNNLSLRLSGPIAKLPAGPIVLSGLMEYQKEEVGNGYSVGGTSASVVPSRSQDLAALYLETKIPLLQSLELQLAARYDDYTLNGTNTIVTTPANIYTAGPVVRTKNQESSVNPTVGLKYQPLQDLTLRASYGTGFLPPSLSQLVPNAPTTSAAATAFIDPRRGGTLVAPPLTFVLGGNADLRPEKSESWSAGFVLYPRFVPELRFSVDYVRLVKTDNLADLTTQLLIDNESAVPGRITRGAPLPGDPAGWAGPITRIDQTTVNISRAWLEAWDLALDYGWDAGTFGRVDFYSVATYQPHYRVRLAPSVAEIENAGVGGSTVAIPLKLKANAGLNWQRQRWSAGWNTTYFDRYKVANPTLSSAATTVQRQGSLYVSSQMFHDLYVGYTFGRLASSVLSLLEDLELTVGVKNVFDTEPEFDAGNTLNLYSGFADPRMASYYLTVKKSFKK